MDNTQPCELIKLSGWTECDVTDFINKKKVLGKDALHFFFL